MPKKYAISLDELIMWREALATVAIEGNVYAQDQLELWKTDRSAFIEEYSRQNRLILEDNYAS